MCTEQSYPCSYPLTSREDPATSKMEELFHLPWTLVSPMLDRGPGVVKGRIGEGWTLHSVS